MKTKVAITGGAGFIGSHVTKLFCDEGYKTIVIDDLRFGYEKFVDTRAEFVKTSLSDETLLNKLLKGVDVVVHLAASSIIRTSFEKPTDYVENNINNGIRLLEAMRKNKVKKIIFSSTASVYGEPINIPVKEDDPKTPETVYGISKLAFEQILFMYYKTYGMSSTSLRYFNAYGPCDEQLPRTRAVPMWIEAVLQNKPVPWYWNGEQTRDFIYVKDVARAHLEVLPLNGCNVFNIGSGKGMRMKDLLKNLEQVVGLKLKTVNKGNREGDPEQLVADTSKIRKQVGWEARTSLQKGLIETFNYYKTHYENSR